MLECCPTEAAGSAAAAGGYGSQMSQGMASLFGGMNMGVDTTSQVAAAAAARSQPSSLSVLSSPPLAALHNMTEMKIPSSSSSALLTPYSQSTGLKQGAFSAPPATPHSIQDILARQATSQAFHSGLAALQPRLNSTAAGLYLNSAAAAASRFPKPLTDLPGRTPIYWPGMLQGPGSWRHPGELRLIYIKFIYHHKKSLRTCINHVLLLFNS